MTRSTPSISSSGNMRPASTMMRSSPSSKAIMFLPISPRPPRGITRSFSAMLQEPHLLRLGLRSRLLRRRLAGPFQHSRYLAEVLFYHLAHVSRVQRRRRVVHRHEINAVPHLRLAVHLADCVARGEPGQGVSPQADDDLRLYQLDLPLEVLAAGVDLPGERVAVVWRAALDDVGDEHLVAAQADGGDQFVQEAAGGPDEGAGLLVLVEAGRLAHEQNVSVRRAFARDGASAGAAEVAVGAGGDSL